MTTDPQFVVLYVWKWNTCTYSCSEMFQKKYMYIQTHNAETITVSAPEQRLQKKQQYEEEFSFH